MRTCERCRQQFLPRPNQRNARWCSYECRYPWQNAEEHFWFYVDKQDDHWLWTGTVNKVSGYGYLTWRRKTVLAHRLAYELEKGPIPKGYHVDHLNDVCGIKLCVWPEHLEAVTPAVNSRRWADTITACIHGHAFDEANTAYDRAGRRRCMQCQRDRKRRFLRGSSTGVVESTENGLVVVRVPASFEVGQKVRLIRVNK